MTTWRHRQRRRAGLRWSGLAAIVLIGAAVVVGLLVRPQPQHPAGHAQTKPPKPIMIGLQSRMLFVGDIYWGRSMNQWAQASTLKAAYPFSRLQEFNRTDYNAWIGNLECPSVTGAHPTPEQEEATLTFNCPPTYMPELAKWFTVVSNANNHSDNQGGQVGLDETRQHLDQVGMQYFGHFDPRQTTKLCEVIALPVKLTLSDHSQQAAKLPFAMCGYHGVFRVPQPDSLAVMRQYATYMPVIAYPHMGVEYRATIDSLRQSVYHSMIDNGADIVFGNHPHWVQPSEAYKGHPIFYSMGNFIFDQQVKPETTRSAAIDITMTLADRAVKSTELKAWTTLGEQCVKFQDDCLAQAEAQHLTRLPLTFKLSIVGVDTSDRITHLAAPSLSAAIKQRLQWSQTLKALQAPYNGE